MTKTNKTALGSRNRTITFSFHRKRDTMRPEGRPEDAAGDYTSDQERHCCLIRDSRWRPIGRRRMQRQRHNSLRPGERGNQRSSRGHPLTTTTTMVPALLLLICALVPFSSAATPDTIVTVDHMDGTAALNIDPLYAKRAQFGSRDDIRGQLVHAPFYDIYLCEWYNSTRNESLPEYPKPQYDTVMLAARGHCTFERKAYAAKRAYGANAVLIYDQLSARYHWNETSERVIYPQSQWDYDCDLGRNVINQSLPLDPPAYNETAMDPLLDMTETQTTICTLQDGRRPCESQMCLITSHVANTTEYPVCCAWDLPLTMPSSEDAQDADTDDIVAVFLTVRQGQEIVQTGLLGRQVVIESRNQMFNVSYLFMWVMGTMIVTVASWNAAGEYRRFGVKLAAYEERKKRTRQNVPSSTPEGPPSMLVVNHGNVPGGKYGSTDNHITEESDGRRDHASATFDGSRNLRPDLESADSDFHDELPSTRQSMLNGQRNDGNEKKNKKLSKKKPKVKKSKQKEVFTLHSIPPTDQKRKKKNSQDTAETTSEEDRPMFALNFRRRGTDNAEMDDNRNHRVVDDGEREEGMPALPARESGRMQAFEMNQWHVLIFIVVASLLLILLFFFQFFNIIFVIYGIGCAGAVSYLIFNPLVVWFFPKLGDEVVEEMNKKVLCGYNGFDITSQLIAYVWAAIFIWFGITKYRPSTNAFFWLTLDFFGACFCVLATSLLKLNSIKMATLLMVAIFIYDIFFVFITPFLTGGDSIMLTVAAGGSEAGFEDYCYKYPDERDCRGIDFLPMLLLLPKVNDYANGSVLLGLGDIILPGFLIALCARHDEASRLVGANMTNTGIEVPKTWYQGYFFPMVVAYAMGLLIAFTAVLLMKQGQPALLYIVPTCLGTMFFMGRNDLKNLWSGARAFKLADRLIERNERAWGKARMKRFVEKRKRENDARAGPVDNSASLEHGQRRPSTEALATSIVQNVRSGKDDHARRRDNTGTNSDRAHSKNSVSEKENAPAVEMAPLRESSSTSQPSSMDICFGDERHPGTVELLRVIRDECNARTGEDFNPNVFKSIRKNLKGRKYYKANRSGNWTESSKLEIRNVIWSIYNQHREIVASAGTNAAASGS